MEKNCLTCNKSFYVSPSRSHIKNCSYVCNKVWRKTNSVQLKPLASCSCGCGKTVKSHRAKYVFGHHPQPIVRRGLFSNGHKTNAGRKHPKEFGEKLSKKFMGRKSNYKGNRHWNWKGGITTEDKAERQRFHKYFRLRVMQRDNYTCQVCNDYGVEVQVDHIKSWAENPELRFDTNNCRTLCTPCHYYLTYKKKMPKGITWGKNLSRRIT